MHSVLISCIMGKKFAKCTDLNKKKKKKTMSQKSKEESSKTPTCSEALLFDFNQGDKESTISSPSLQDAFLNFRKKKQEEILTEKNATSRRNADPARMLRLRKKFLDQCKTYMGVPYKKKYHKPGSVEYNSSLFLDCCGLVRRVLRDLSNDFGFRIGPWNQAYLHDTLPLVLNSEDEMQPGDLVFISGVYFQKKMRRQPHNMVHVEVWLGEGVKTIGARWHRGRVQVFDSYKFESTSYHTMTYHFRSIDTWLEGVCKSFCERHPWKRPGQFSLTKRSVFFDGRLAASSDGATNHDPSMEDNNVEDASEDEDNDQEATSSDVLECCKASTRGVVGTQWSHDAGTFSCIEDDSSFEGISSKENSNTVSDTEVFSNCITESESQQAKTAVSYITFAKSIGIQGQLPSDNRNSIRSSGAFAPSYAGSKRCLTTHRTSTEKPVYLFVNKKTFLKSREAFQAQSAITKLNITETSLGSCPRSSQNPDQSDYENFSQQKLSDAFADKVSAAALENAIAEIL